MQKIVNQILENLKLSHSEPVTIKNWATSLLATKITEVLEFLDKTKANIDHTHESSVPVGAIFAFPTDVELSGYLKCNGVLYAKSQYPKLAQLLVNFTPSNTNSTHFNVPDFRGQYLRGADDSGSSHIDYTGMTDIVTNQPTTNTKRTGVKLTDSLKSHSHAVSDSGHNHSAGQEPHYHWYGDSYDQNNGVSVLGAFPGFGPVVDGVGDAGYSGNGTSVAQPTVYVGVNTSNISVQNSGQVETRPKSILICYYIKCD
jgi:hypothetical protein